MPRNSMTERLNKKCRICLSDEGSMLDIFTVELNPKIQELAESTSIHIHDEENLPRQICHVCLYKLEMWCDFKRQFIHTNKILLQHVKDNYTIDYTGSAAKRRRKDKQEELDISMVDAEGTEKLKLNDTGLKSAKSVDDDKSTVSPIIIIDDSDDCDKSTLPIAEASTIELATTSGGGGGDECQVDSSSIIKSRSFSGRRTSEQRLASTQRWVARKKARLAANGEKDSDTDSMSSDSTQLSPIQKARSRNHVENQIERLKRLNKSINDEEKNDDSIKNENDYNMKNSNESKESFESRTIQSELVIGDATFIVTSKLILSEPQCLNDTLNNMSQIPLIENTMTAATALNNQQQNTDIIDAVELRRVNQSKEKNFIERCLNIEVEGTDLQALQRIQVELDNYLMTDMKQKLSNSIASAPDLNKMENNKFQQQPPKNSFETLEQQLKTIVEKAVRKNLEMSKMRRVPISKIAMSNNRGNKIFSAAFIKAAMKSQIFQPKVVLNRVEPTKETTLFNENSPETASKSEVMTKNKIDNDVNEGKKYIEASPIINDNDTNKNYLIDKKPSLDGANYSCSICNELFATKMDIERHLDSHKYSKNAKTPINIISKRKMMRCKCCHEVVESRYVKSHICHWKKSLYYCSTCKISFKNDHLLMNHLKTHHEAAAGAAAAKDVEVITAEAEVKEVTEERAMVDEVKIERVENISQINKSMATSFATVTDKTDDTTNKLNTKITIYTCFVCDKNFTDEELMKDHLQQHCDDVSDDDKNKNNVKEDLYQCAICGETLKSEAALEYHVEEHLFDDNTNVLDNKPAKNNSDELSAVKFDNGLNNKLDFHTCVQCNEQFDNEINLALHVQGHEEESAIAEWEKHGLIKGEQVCDTHVCTICDDTFDCEEALAHHIDIHNESTHTCILCDKPFLTLSELQNHVNTH